MQKPNFDPGLTQQYTGSLRRTVNRYGDFNVRRKGANWRDLHPYLFLVNLPFSLFLGYVVGIFILLNVVFASLYLLTGAQHIRGMVAGSKFDTFANAFFFSVHTLTTVGYGNMYPVGIVANSLASVEALVGLLILALITGLLFGRFSRPSARIGFSRNMLVSPYQNGLSLQFRVVNRRTNNLVNVSSRVLLMTVETVDERPLRRFTNLELERNEILFFPLTWTVVHPLDEKSPLFGKSPEEYERLQAEIIIVMNAFDETSGQTVHARYSYRYDDLTWNAKFAPAFEIDGKGEMVVEVDKVGALEPLEWRR